MIYYAIRFPGGDNFVKVHERQTLTKGVSHSIRRVALKNASLWTDQDAAISILNNSRQSLELVKIDVRISTVSLEKKR